MLKRVALWLVVVALSSLGVAAQTKTAPANIPKPAESQTASAKPAPAEQPLPVNIRIEVSITDQTGANPGAKKVVTMIVGDRQTTSIRSSASVPVKNAGPMQNYRNVTINVDATPAILLKEPNKVMVRFGLEYAPKSRSEPEEMEPGMASINERLGLILESGKPLIVSQAADPTSDRKITVEVTATILK
ncbi:MAG: hypothetical protein ABIQ52_04740 [Vicinamibacterales bacterium]